MFTMIKKYQTLIIIAAVASLIGYLYVANKIQAASYEKQISTLTTSISDMKTAQLEANRKQQEYIDRVYKQMVEVNEDIDKRLKETNYDVQTWVDAVSRGIDDRMQQTIEGAIRSSRTETLNSAKTAANDIGRILASKFSDEVSRELVEIAADAERTRVALRECIVWGNEAQRIINDYNAQTGNNKVVDPKKAKKK